MSLAFTPYVSGLAQEAYRTSFVRLRERHLSVIHADLAHERYMSMEN
jgi:hypothetical protein